MATAIGLSESDGDERAISKPNPNGTIDVGIWQINSTHLRDHPEWTTAWLQNPDNNAKAMAVLSAKGLNWFPWSDYKNGKYKAHLPEARKAVEEITLSKGVGDVLGDVPIVGDAIDAAQVTADVLKGIADPIIAGAKWIGNPKNWIRIIEVGGGLALALGAVSVIKDVKDTII